MRYVPGRADAVKRTAESDAAPDAGVTDKNIIMEDGIMKIAVTYENGGVFQREPLYLQRSWELMETVTARWLDS